MRGWRKALAALAIVAGSGALLAQDLVPRVVEPAPAESAEAGEDVPVSPPLGAAELTTADVDAWLDGFMPYAIESGDIAGAVVVVVKDGAIANVGRLTEEFLREKGAPIIRQCVKEHIRNEE